MENYGFVDILCLYLNLKPANDKHLSYEDLIGQIPCNDSRKLEKINSVVKNIFLIFDNELIDKKFFQDKLNELSIITFDKKISTIELLLDENLTFLKFDIDNCNTIEDFYIKINEILQIIKKEIDSSKENPEEFEINLSEERKINFEDSKRNSLKELYEKGTYDFTITFGSIIYNDPSILIIDLSDLPGIHYPPNYC